jgi:hypothetical protein
MHPQDHLLWRKYAQNERRWLLRPPLSIYIGLCGWDVWTYCFLTHFLEPVSLDMSHEKLLSHITVNNGLYMITMAFATQLIYGSASVFLHCCSLLFSCDVFTWIGHVMQMFGPTWWNFLLFICCFAYLRKVMSILCQKDSVLYCWELQSFIARLSSKYIHCLSIFLVVQWTAISNLMFWNTDPLHKKFKSMTGMEN